MEPPSGPLVELRISLCRVCGYPTSYNPTKITDIPQSMMKHTNSRRLRVLAQLESYADPGLLEWIAVVKSQRPFCA